MIRDKRLAAGSVEFLAHRGASDVAPENTLAAIKLAWEQGADAVEIDVHLTKDDRVMVMHDANTARICGRGLAIRESTLEELRELDAGAWKGQQWVGEKIPTLEEALSTIPKGKRIFVEVKCGPEGLPAFERALKSAEVSTEQVAVISFSIEVVTAAKQQLPQIPSYWLVSPFAGYNDELIRTATNAGADGLDLCVLDAIDEDFVRRVRGAGLGLYVWAVELPDVARRMVELEVDGITSNRAAWLKGEIAER